MSGVLDFQQLSGLSGRQSVYCVLVDSGHSGDGCDDKQGFDLRAVDLPVIVPEHQHLVQEAQTCAEDGRQYKYLAELPAHQDHPVMAVRAETPDILKYLKVREPHALASRIADHSHCRDADDKDV